jgi:dTMP kinase
VSRRGFFITVEGIEGSGKSMQIASLARFLRGRGKQILVTREPGGTRAGDAVRRILLGTKSGRLEAWTEFFLFEAARVQHLSELVRPALARGSIVLCDRFTDSTLAYQGYGRGLPRPMIEKIHALPALGPVPDLTIIFDLPVRAGLARIRTRNASSAARRRESRIDDEPARFHERVRRGFRAIAAANRGRVAIVDGSRPPDAVARAVREIVLARLDDAR